MSELTPPSGPLLSAGRFPEASPPMPPAPSGPSPDAPIPPPPPTRSEEHSSARGRSKLAVASLVVAILGVVIPFAGAVVAIGLAIAGLLAISNSGATLRGKGLAIAALVLAAVSIVAWGLAVAAWSDGSSGSFLEGLVASQKAAAQLDIGDCLQMSTDEGNDFQVGARDVVGCDTPHDGEYIGSFFLPELDDAPYPSEDDVFNRSLLDCVDKFNAYVGTDYLEDQNYEIIIWFPDERSWERFNDRESACFIISLDGAKLTKSARGYEV